MRGQRFAPAALPGVFPGAAKVRSAVNQKANRDVRDFAALHAQIELDIEDFLGARTWRRELGVIVADVARLLRDGERAMAMQQDSRYTFFEDLFPLAIVNSDSEATAAIEARWGERLSSKPPPTDSLFDCLLLDVLEIFGPEKSQADQLLIEHLPDEFRREVVPDISPAALLDAPAGTPQAVRRGCCRQGRARHSRVLTEPTETGWQWHQAAQLSGRGRRPRNCATRCPNSAARGAAPRRA